MKRNASPILGISASIVYYLAIVLGLYLSVTRAARAQDAAEVAANACLDGVSELYPQHRFTEAADKYNCAADALAKSPGHDERAARYRANAWFYRSSHAGKPRSVHSPATLERPRIPVVCKWNWAAEHARGQWLAVLDADDWYGDERLHRLIALAEAADVEMVAGSHAIMSKMGDYVIAYALPR